MKVRDRRRDVIEQDGNTRIWPGWQNTQISGSIGLWDRNTSDVITIEAKASRNPPESNTGYYNRIGGRRNGRRPCGDRGRQSRMGNMVPVRGG